MYYLLKYEAAIETESGRKYICGTRLVSVISRHYPSNGSKKSLRDAEHKLKEFLVKEHNAKVVALKTVENLTIH